MAANFPTSDPSFTKKDYVNRETPLVADYNKALEEIESIGTWLRGDTVPKSTTADLTYYVNSSTGSDDNDGSQEHPFATINKALGLIPQVVNHSVDIYILDGTYAETIGMAGKLGKGYIIISGDYATTGVQIDSIYGENNTCALYFSTLEVLNTNYDSVYFENNPGMLDFYAVNSTQTSSSFGGFCFKHCPSVSLYYCTISNRRHAVSSTFSNVCVGECAGSNNNAAFFSYSGIIFDEYSSIGGNNPNILYAGGQILSTQLANRDEDAVEGNLAKFDSSGNPVDSGIDPDTKADKDPDAVEGNLAEFDANGNPVDSGISPSNLIQGLSLIQNGSFEIVDSNSLPWCWEKIGTATLAQDTGVNDGFGGSNALKVTSAGASNEGAKYTFRHLKPSTTYSIRIWMKATAGDTAKAWTTGGSSNLSITSTNTTGEYKTGSFTTDATPTNVILNVGSETNGDIVWFDALTIIEGSTAPDKYLPSPQPTVFEFQDFYLVGTTLPGLETLTGSNITKKYVYALDDTEATAITEPLGFNFSIPPNFDPSGFIMLDCVGWAKTPAASKNIEYTYYYSPKKYGEDWDTAYSSLVSGDLALYSTQDYRDNLRFQLSINTAGLEPYDVVESKISRTAPSANNLTGDYYFEKLRIWIPRV